MAADDDRLSRLEQRIAALEDQIAIYQLLMTYGPSADSGSDASHQHFRDGLQAVRALRAE